MHLNKKVLALMATSAVAVGALAGPISGASAKTLKISFTTKSTNDGKPTDISSTLSSPQLGKGKQTGFVLVPVAHYTWKFKNCTLIATGAGTLKGTKVVGGKWKLTKGKSKGSKCKGATGSGTFTGDLAAAGVGSSKGVFKFKGTIKTK